MSDTEPIDQEPKDGEALELPIKAKTRTPFAKLRRELSEEELSSSAVQRLLLDEIERLERQVTELTGYRKRFYDMDKRTAVLEQRVQKSLASEMIFAVCLAVGAAALGYAPSLWSQQPSGYISLIFGAVLIIGGIASRLVQR